MRVAATIALIWLLPLGAHSATVKFNYVGRQLEGIGSFSPSPGDIVTASVTFDATYSEFGYPGINGVLDWEVITPYYTLGPENGYLIDDFPLAPFVIRNGEMYSWDFQARNSQVPYKAVTLISDPSLSVVYAYEYVYSQNPNFSAKSVNIGTWTQTIITPLPLASILMGSGLILLLMWALCNYPPNNRLHGTCGQLASTLMS